MADTRYLTKQVEEHVRGALADQYGQPFTKERLTLTGIMSSTPSLPTGQSSHP